MTDADLARLLALPVERHFECFFTFLGWWHWSIGVHLDLRHPHVDVHVPFGYGRIGWFRCPTISAPRVFGYRAWWYDDQLRPPAREHPSGPWAGSLPLSAHINEDPDD